MTRREDGSFTCDKDGVDLGNGGVDQALIVNDLDPDRPGHVRVFHFCRDREENGKKIKGCASKVLSATNIKNWMEKLNGAQ